MKVRVSSSALYSFFILRGVFIGELVIELFVSIKVDITTGSVSPDVTGRCWSVAK